MAVSKKLKLAH